MKKFKHMKAWPTRRVHLFPKDGSNVSSCGLVTQGQSFYICDISSDDALKKHHYDDLNYCQSCLRSLLKENGKKYVPLSTIYQKPNADIQLEFEEGEWENGEV